MKINKIKINSYGKLKNKEIKFNKGINVIYGKNEAGKSTLINYIINSFYGISKNKNKKEISDFDRYKPWNSEEFSGKIEYELDNNELFEVYNDFNKKNTKIFNENKEDISNNFDIDKNKGNNFFYEQTKIDKNLFLSTLAINQGDIKIEKNDQIALIQKIANLSQTGDDDISIKKVIDRINKRQLDEIGTERSREKPINQIRKKLQELIDEKQRLEKYRDLKYEFEEEENEIKEEISKLEIENKLLMDLKLLEENKKIEIEKIKIKEKIKNDDNEKINIINNEINKVKNNNKLLFDKYSDNNLKNKKIKNKLNNKKNNSIKILNLIFIILIFINVFQFIFLKNKIIKNIFLLTVPIYLIFYIIFIINKNKKIKNINKIEKNKYEKINSELINLINKKNIIENNLNNLNEEINKIKNNFNFKINLEKEKIKNKYLNNFDKIIINELIYENNLENINLLVKKNQNLLNGKKLKLHSLYLDEKNIEPELEKLSKIEEDIVNYNNKMSTIEEKNESMNLVKKVMESVYDKMKKLVTPKFIENLSSNISNITGNKYNNVFLNDDKGIVVEVENGEYISASRLSLGTIDQLYLALRLSMVNELVDESIPILLDETFAYYDNERLENILLYLNREFSDRQIIIFTCGNREKEILNNNCIDYNLINI